MKDELGELDPRQKVGNVTGNEKAKRYSGRTLVGREDMKARPW